MLTLRGTEVRSLTYPFEGEESYTQNIHPSQVNTEISHVKFRLPRRHRKAHTLGSMLIPKVEKNRKL